MFFFPQMKGVEVTGVKRVFVEGEDCDDWMVVDMGECVCECVRVDKGECVGV